MAVPRLSLDRPFTYLLPETMDGGIGSLVSVPFHGRTVKGWVLGPAAETPPGRLLPVRRVRSPVRLFDLRMLAVLRWVSERYIAPLAVVIERSHPPRVARVERELPGEPKAVTGAQQETPGTTGPELRRYGAAAHLDGGTVTWLRPLPGDEQTSCLQAVEACLAGGRQALVIVPEANPVPATAAAVLEGFGARAASFLGGDAAERYRRWLEIRAGRFSVVVGTRPAVFAPLARLGLIWIAREVHPGHREDRAPYYHVRDVAAARARLEGAACVLAAISPSVETAAAAATGAVRVARPARALERAAAPLVETVPPEAEDRSVRLGSLLRTAGSGALIASRRGYGVARVCRTCGSPAACSTCAGPIVVEGSVAACRVCGTRGRCRSCGGETFGVERGGTERVAEWASSLVRIPVVRAEEGSQARPGDGTILVGTAAAVRDAGPVRVDVVAILDPDRALARPGLRAGEQALATWMEAAAWAGSRAGPGRVLVQTRHPGHPAIQALVRWDPLPFLIREGARRAEAGFPPGHAVFRVIGSATLATELAEAGAAPVVSTTSGEETEERTLCLVAAPAPAAADLRRTIVRLAESGVVSRVEAEPDL